MHACVPRSPLHTKDIVCAQDFIGSLKFREMVVGGGPPATTITRVHFKHNQHMHVVATLLGRILGISLIVIPMFPSQPFPFVQPHLYRDVRSGILDYTNPTTSHHLLESEGNLSLHFPKLREQENLRALEQKQQAARIAAVQKKLDKLTPVGEFEKCCAR